MPDKRQALHYALSGITHQDGFRLFAFLETSEDNRRVPCVVRADLGLVRKYGIRIQELPLLCRELLERRAEPDSVLRLTLTEEDMRAHQANRQVAEAAAALSRKTGRRPVAHL